MLTRSVTLTSRSTLTPINIPTPAPLTQAMYTDIQRLAPPVTITAPSKNVSWDCSQGSKFKGILYIESYTHNI